MSQSCYSESEVNPYLFIKTCQALISRCGLWPIPIIEIKEQILRPHHYNQVNNSDPFLATVFRPNIYHVSALHW